MDGQRLAGKTLDGFLAAKIPLAAYNIQMMKGAGETLCQ